MNNNEYNLDDEEISPNKPLEPKTEEAPSVNINRYHDQDGISMAKLELGLWYVENKLKIVEFVYFILFLVGVFSWFYFFYEFGLYAFKGISNDRTIIREVLAENLPDYNYYTERMPVDLQLYPVKTIIGTANKRDLLAQVKNPNNNYWARFHYYFLNNNKKVGEKKGFVLPGETKQLLALGQDISASVGGLQLVIEDIQWGRVNPHEFGVWKKFKKDHLNFSFSNIIFNPSNNSVLTEKIPLNTLSFHAENKTSFNYWKVPLIISLYNYKDLVSVTSYEINDFESGRDLLINFTLPGNLRKITNIEIVANLDVSRLDLYKEFKAPMGIFR